MLFLYRDGFGIKYPIKVDIPLNEEIKPNQFIQVNTFLLLF